MVLKNKKCTKKRSSSAMHILPPTPITAATATTVLRRERLSPSQNQNENSNTTASMANRQYESCPFLSSNATTINAHSNQQIQQQQQQVQRDLPQNVMLNVNKKTSKNNNIKKFLLIMFLSICLFGLLLLGTTHFPTAAAAGTNPRVPERMPNAEPGECPSTDIRNECESIYQLTNCTMIRGFLLFVLRPFHTEQCDYTNISFPLLREITDFLIMHDVRGLRSMRDLFPNLTVIRGRRLFLNYALGITHMNHLEAVEFRSLIAIQHGHVFINSPIICNLKKINWDRITLSVGENHIYLPEPEECPDEVICQGCATEYCWTNETCQHFENDNLIEPSQGIQHCHEECLGGCYNSSHNGCLLCKHLTDHGACVKECPEGKYLVEFYQNCTTESECLALNMTIEGRNCTLHCKDEEIMGYDERERLACVACDTPFLDDLLEIKTLSDANRISGCTSLNASIRISIRNDVNEEDLAVMLGKLREVRGSLRIHRSSLKSLKFLSGLRRIATEPSLLEAGIYGIVLYDNENLEELWPADKLEIVHGSMYIHTNKKLCNRKLRKFTHSIVHDRSKDSIQVNDQEVLCDPAKLPLDIEVLSHRSARFSWPKEHTSSEVEILYRSVYFDDDLNQRSELDTDICHRIEWTRKLLGLQELNYNDTSYSYTVTDLKPFARYACLVKTFGLDDTKDARSDLTYIETKQDLPSPPIIEVQKKTNGSANLKFTNPREEAVDYYLLEVYELKDDQATLDRRDFCLQQSYLYDMVNYGHNDDYDDIDTCCSRKEEAIDDIRFQRKMQELYRCDADHMENCIPGIGKSESLPFKALLRMHIDAHTTHNVATVRFLTGYTLYAIQVQSCNMAGCGAYTFYPLRTAATAHSERLDDLRSCRVANTNEFHVYFSEPKHTSDPILSYVVHFRQRIHYEKKYLTHIECMTRLQHHYNNNHFIAQLDAPFNEVAVRVITLSGSQLSNWYAVPICPDAKDVSDIDKSLEQPEPRMGSGTVVVLVGLLATIFGIVAWSCYKTRCWRNNGGFWRRLLAPLYGWQILRRDEAQQLVEFRNIAEDDLLANEAN